MVTLSAERQRQGTLAVKQKEKLELKEIRSRAGDAKAGDEKLGPPLSKIISASFSYFDKF